MGQALGLTGVLSGFTVLLLHGGLWAGTYFSDIRLELILVGGIGCAAWILISFVRASWLPSSSLTPAFAASLTAFAICGAVAWEPRLGLDYLAYAVLLASLYLLLVRIWAVPMFSRALGLLLIILTVLIGAMYVASVFGQWLNYWRDLGHLAAPPLRPGYDGLWLGNPNALASLLLLFLVVAVPALPLRRRAGRLVAVGIGLLVGFDILLTGSRGAWLGLAMAFAVAGIVWLSSAARREALRALFGRGNARKALIAGAITMSGLAVVFAPALASRLGEHGVDTRVSFWAASVRMFEAQPLTGVGPGAWAPARQTFTTATDADYYIPHAHNVPLQVAAEFGVVGIAAAAVVVVTMLRMLAHGLRSQTPQARAYAWAALFGVTYLCGQQLVDAYIHQPAILLALALPISRLDQAVSDAAPDPGPRVLRPRRRLAAAMLVGVAVAVFAAASVEPAATAQERAVDAARAGDWPTALADAREAVSADPNMAPYQFMLGLAAARTGDLAAAKTALRQSAALDDYPQAWLALAAVEARVGNPAEERLGLAHALRLGVQQPQVAVAGAAMLVDLGSPDAAVDALSAAFVEAPSLASDPYWSTGQWATIARQAAVRAQVASGTTWNGYMLALERQDSTTAMSLATQLPGGNGAAWMAAILAWGGDESAFSGLSALAASQPLDVALSAVCRRVAEVRRAAGNADWTCDNVRPTGIYPIVRVGTPLPGQVMPEPAAYPQAFFGYRRFGPDDLYLPWMLQLRSTIP